MRAKLLKSNTVSWGRSSVPPLLRQNIQSFFLSHNDEVGFFTFIGKIWIYLWKRSYRTAVLEWKLWIIWKLDKGRNFKKHKNVCLSCPPPTKSSIFYVVWCKKLYLFHWLMVSNSHFIFLYFIGFSKILCNLVYLFPHQTPNRQRCFQICSNAASAKGYENYTFQD